MVKIVLVAAIVGGSAGRIAAPVGETGTLIESSPAIAPPLASALPSSLSAPSIDHVSSPLASVDLPDSAILSAAGADDTAAEAASAIPPISETSAESSLDRLDALFDGSMPASREVLSRAKRLGLNGADVALAISGSRSPSEAAARLSALGVLGSGEAGLAASREDEFRYLLTRLWRKTATSVPPAFEIDKSFGIPALKVEKGGVTYFVHAVAHGPFGAPRRGAVLSTVRRIAAAGHALYSEQNLPAYYGYKNGLETLDLAAADGAPVEIVPAAPGHSRATLLVKRALGALAWLALVGGFPLMRWKRRRLAAKARAEGLEDVAEQFDDEARNFFVAKPDLEVLRGLELPQPLGAADDPFSTRSRAIADAVAADAAASGSLSTHVVVGHMHVHETAWRLANGPRTSASETQIS